MVRSLSFGLVMTLAAGVALGQGNVTAPNANDTVAGNGGLNTVVRDSGFPRTYQFQVAASELASIPPGASITGMQWRLQPSAANGTSWPASDVTWSTYDVTMAQAANPIGSMSTTFAANMTNPMIVRTGPMTIGPNSYPGGVTAPPAVNGWGPMVVFTTPYTYGGGDLVVYLTHPGSNIVGNRFLDSLTTTGPGYGTAVRAFSATTQNATVGAAAAHTIVRFEWSPGGGMTNPTGAGSISPGCMVAGVGGSAHLRVNVFPGANPPSTGITVTADTTQLGGAPGQSLFDDGAHGDGAAGDNEFGLDITVPSSVTVGIKSVPFTVADAESRSSNGSMSTTVAGAGAGEGIATAIEPSGSGDLTQIDAPGHLGGTADLFKINICDPANFSATTVGGATIDTQLFLFDSSGMGIVSNDDNPAGGTTSVLTNAFTSSLSPGTYYLGLTSYNRDPIGNACDTTSLIWLNTPFNTERAPDGPAAGSPLSAWTGTGTSGPVTIFLTGTRYPNSACSNPCDVADTNCDGALNGFDVQATEEAVNGDFSNFCLPSADLNQDGAENGFDVEFSEALVNQC